MSFKNGGLLNGSKEIAGAVIESDYGAPAAGTAIGIGSLALAEMLETVAGVTHNNFAISNVEIFFLNAGCNVLAVSACYAAYQYARNAISRN